MRYFEENNNMKEILLILVINIISMFFAIKKSFNIEGVLLAFIFTNLIAYFFVSAGTYYFIVDSDSKIIFVRNRFKPWKQINYNIKDVVLLDFLWVNDLSFVFKHFHMGFFKAYYRMHVLSF